jgi:hypothetical protein
MRILTLLGLIVCVSACRDECSAKTDPGHCEGNTAVNCPSPGVDQIVPVRWHHSDCDTRVCVQAGTAALCVLDGGASPFCTGDRFEACDATTRVRCSSGFETAREPCLSCDGDGGTTTCVGGPSSRCATDNDCASPYACKDAGTNSYCFKK